MRIATLFCFTLLLLACFNAPPEQKNDTVQREAASERQPGEVQTTDEQAVPEDAGETGVPGPTGKAIDTEQETDSDEVLPKKPGASLDIPDQKNEISVRQTPESQKNEPQLTTAVEQASGISSAPVADPTPVTITPAPDLQVKGEPVAAQQTDTDRSERAHTADLSHQAWDKVLRKYVSATGKVNYKGMKAEEAELDAYLDHLENTPVQQDWSRAKKMAYWINAYNAFTVKLILKNYPVSSITKLEGGKPWDVKWIRLGDKTYSLNNIEHDILRPQFKDARIHFAVNCAARSCPPLLNRAWTEENLNDYFDQQAKAFINDPKYNEIRTSEVTLSKIFEWYREDFGNLIDFLNKYSTTSIKENAEISFKEYDWTLNE